MLTLRELAERLKREDEVYLLELLGITSDQLVERCIDLIEDRYDEIVGEYEQEEAGWNPWGGDEDTWTSEEEGFYSNIEGEGS